MLGAVSVLVTVDEVVRGRSSRAPEAPLSLVTGTATPVHLRARPDRLA